MRYFGWLAVLTVVAQAILGGLTVILRQPVPVSVAHACLAQVFFCAVVSLALFTSRWWQTDFAAVEDTGSPSLRTLALLCVGATFLQLTLGAAFRHNGLGIVPHLIGAVVVTAMIFWTACGDAKSVSFVGGLHALPGRAALLDRDTAYARWGGVVVANCHALKIRSRCR